MRTSVFSPDVDFEIIRGRCHVYFAFEVGLAINLSRAEQHLGQEGSLAHFRRSQRGPKYFDYEPPPLRVTQKAGVVPGLEERAARFESVDLTLFDFGAISVAYTFAIPGLFSSLIPLSERLYDNDSLLDEAIERVRALVRDLGDAVTQPQIAELFEDYLVMEITQTDPEIHPEELRSTHGRTIAQILRCEHFELAMAQVEDALQYFISYGPGDLVVIDWNAALVFGGDGADVQAVLEFGNAELLELRHLDRQLDQFLERAYHSLTTGRTAAGDLRAVAQLQVDSAMMYEAVNNALKLLGDQYLARVYSLVTKRFHLAEWDASILRKLDVLDGIYQKISDRAAQRRTELLEVVIILLILAEIAISIFGHK